MTRERFGRYEVQEEIGDGAMGRVYRCFDPLMRRTVAVKTVKSEYLTRDSREEYLRRFRREAQAAGALAHPHIVSIFDVGEDYFVMEYLEGSTLHAILNARKRLPLEEALALLTPVADALDHAHRAHIVHRDVKPANIMVLPDGRPKLMDFGVAHLASSIATAAGQIFGSPSYMAPEQVAGHEVTHRADLFAFAVVAYEVITGQRPFQGDSITAIIYRVVNDEAAPPRRWDVDLPAVYDDIFRRALRKNPGERYPDASSLVNALHLREFDAALLEAFSDSPPLPPSPLDLPPPTSPDLRDLSYASAETHALGTQFGRVSGPRRVLLWAGGAALAVALGLALWPQPKSVPGPASAQAEAVPQVFRVESEPAGASLWLDGERRGATPVALTNLSPGRHKIRVVAEGFAPAELSMEIPPGTPPLRFVMEPSAARLVVSSEPAGASVLVDGEDKGSTPLPPLSVPPGRHVVRVEKKGFLPFSRIVESVMGQALPISATLSPVPPRAKGVTSAPPATLSPSWVTVGELVSLDDTVASPRRISGTPPPYPEIARRMKMLGAVRVEMIVDENGVPQDLRVSESAGPVLDQAVLDAVRGWRYDPARKNGVKVKVRWHERQSFVAR
jgi:eukaryotic-like serine/threonine-protein kinase